VEAAAQRAAAASAGVIEEAMAAAEAARRQASQQSQEQVQGRAPPPGVPTPLTWPACRRGAQRTHLTWVANSPANYISITCRSKHCGDSALRQWRPVSGTSMAWLGASVSMSLHAWALLRSVHQHPGPSALEPKNPTQHFMLSIIHM